jgi:hypothetical protein
MSDWSVVEDGQPGKALVRTQPELTSRGKVWTQLIEVNWPMEGRTQLIIRESSGGLLLDHGRVFPLRAPENEDGA